MDNPELIRSRLADCPSQLADCIVRIDSAIEYGIGARIVPAEIAAASRCSHCSMRRTAHCGTIARIGI